MQNITIISYNYFIVNSKVLYFRVKKFKNSIDKTSREYYNIKVRRAERGISHFKASLSGIVFGITFKYIMIENTETPI